MASTVPSIQHRDGKFGEFFFSCQKRKRDGLRRNNTSFNQLTRGRYGELRKALVELGKQLPGYGGTTVANFKTNSGMILSFLQIEWRR